MQEMARSLRLLRYILYANFSQILEVLRDFHRLFGSRNSPITGILREVKPRFGAALERSAHDCETGLQGICLMTSFDFAAIYCADCVTHERFFTKETKIPNTIACLKAFWYLQSNDVIIQMSHPLREATDLQSHKFHSVPISFVSFAPFLQKPNKGFSNFLQISCTPKMCK